MKMSATTTTTTSTTWNADEGSSRAARTVAYFASFVALGLTLGAFGPTLPSLAERMGVTIGEIGSLFVARSLGFLLVSVRGGRLYDRAPGHRVLAAMLLVMALSMALVPVVPRLWLLAFVIACLGAAEGLLDVGANTLLVRAHGHRVGPYMNGLHFFYGVGALAAPLVVARLLPFSNGLSLAYWTLALLIVPIVIRVARLPSPPARHANEVAGGGEIDRRTVALVALFFFLYVGAEFSFGGWIYSYVVVRRLGDAAAAAYLTSGFWGAFTLGRLVSVPLAARFSPRALVSASLACCGLSLALILSRPDSLTAFAVGAIALGLSMAAIFPSMFSLVGSRMELTGRIAGWLVVGASAGSMFLPWLAGRLFDTTGPRSMVVAVTCALGLAACVFAALTRNPARPARAVPA